jgi:hypothetical protein
MAPMMGIASWDTAKYAAESTTITWTLGAVRPQGKRPEEQVESGYRSAILKNAGGAA